MPSLNARVKTNEVNTNMRPLAKKQTNSYVHITTNFHKLGHSYLVGLTLKTGAGAPQKALLEECNFAAETQGSKSTLTLPFGPQARSRLYGRRAEMKHSLENSRTDLQNTHFKDGTLYFIYMF